MGFNSGFKGLTLQDLVFPTFTAMFKNDVSYSFRKSNSVHVDCRTIEWSDVRCTEFSDCSFQWKHTVISATYELCLYDADYCYSSEGLSSACFNS